METNQYFRESNDPLIERAACDFFRHIAREGRPRKRGMSFRFGNLVTVFGVPLTVGYYQVFKRRAGREDIRRLDDPSEEELTRSMCAD